MRLSPDGTRVALEIDEPEQDIWVWHLARETLTRVTTDPGLDETPVWMPDGRRLVFTSQAGGVLGSLFWQAADGSGVAGAGSQGDTHRSARRASCRTARAMLFSEGTGNRMAHARWPKRRSSGLVLRSHAAWRRRQRAVARRPVARLRRQRRLGRAAECS